MQYIFYMSISLVISIALYKPLFIINYLLIMHWALLTPWHSFLYYPLISKTRASLVAQLVKESTCNAGHPGSIPGWGRCPGEGIGYLFQCPWASLVTQTVKNLPATWETWIGKIPWRRVWQPTPVFLPGEFPMDRGSWRATVHGVAESDMTEWLSAHKPHFLWEWKAAAVAAPRVIEPGYLES